MAKESFESDSTASVSDAIALLNAVAPSKVADLVAEYPEYKDDLTRGRKLGAPSGVKEKFELDAALKGLETAYQLAGRTLPIAQSRLRLSQQLEFLARVFSLVSSSGTLVLLLKIPDRAIVGAICSFFASVLLLGTNSTKRGFGGGKDEMLSLHAKLSRAVPEIAFHKGRLGGYQYDDFKDAKSKAEFRKLIERAFQLCRNVHEWADRVPGSGKVRIDA
jgi:hypothetical protein